MNTENSLIYRVCKRTIERGNYPDNMRMRIEVFCADGLISIEERDELKGMLPVEEV